MDIISLPIDVDKTKIEGNYRLVVASVIRAKELAKGVPHEIYTNSQKVTTIAIEEITAGNLNVLIGDEAVEAKEKAKKLEQKRAVEESRETEKFPDDLTEFEKDARVYQTEKVERDSKKLIEEIFGDGKE